MDRAGLGVDVDAVDLLARLRAEGFELQVAGDRLRIRPAERVSPELRDLLVRRQRELQALLAPPSEYVHLRPLPDCGGLHLPLPVLQLAWNLEERGFRLSVDVAGDFQIEPAAALTDHDRAGIHRWRRHLAALTTYVNCACEAPIT